MSKREKEKTIDEIMSLTPAVKIEWLSPDEIERLDEIDRQEEIKRRAELGETPEEDIIRTPEEFERRSVEAFYKAEEKGVGSLDSSERNLYKYYLWCRVYKLNGKGEAVKPIHANVADLALCDMRVFILHDELYIYDPRVGTYRRDNNAQKLRRQIRAILDREFIEDKTICSICNLIMNDRRYMIRADQVNNRPAHWIHFKNGYYDYLDDVVRPHNPDYNDVSVIPWDYEPYRCPCNYKYVKQGKGLLQETVTESLLFDAWIERAIPNFNDRVMLYQYIAYAMTLRTNEQKFLLICGPGGTGKSTLLKLIEEIIGASNVSGISLQGLQERFAPVGLFLKQANICADIPLTALTEIDMIKKLTGEDTITADRKMKSFISFRSYARLFFSANSIPYIDEQTNALYRRMLILKMDNVPDSVDQGLYEKLRAEIPNIITKLMEEIYCSAGEIDISENCKKSVREAHKDSDSVAAFLDDRCINDPDARTDRRTLYNKYKNYCYSDGRKALTPNGFYKALNNKGYKQIKGKTRDFIGIKLTNTIPFIHTSTANTETDTASNGS